MGSRKVIREITLANEKEKTKRILIRREKDHIVKRFILSRPVEHDDLRPHTSILSIYFKHRYMGVTEKKPQTNNTQNEIRLSKAETGNFTCHPMEEKLERKIKDEQIENFIWLNSLLKNKLDMEHIRELIEKIPLYIVDKDCKTEFNGIYNDKERSISYIEDIAFNDYKNSKKTRFHEFIHYIQDVLYVEQEGQNAMYSLYMKEAQTESLAKRRFDFGSVTPIPTGDTVIPTLIISNYANNKSYALDVIILRQMEAVMGEKSYEDRFDSEIEFSKQFMKKYGLALYTFLVKRMFLLEHNTDDSGRIRGYAQFELLDTQNKLMKEVFRQEFNRMNTIEDAVDMLTKLQELRRNRAEIHVKKENGKVENISSIEEYYNRLYSRIGHKLLKKGYSKEEIATALEPFKYKEMNFEINYDIGDVEDNIPYLVNRFVELLKEENNIEFDNKMQKLEYMVTPEGDIYIGCADRESNDVIVLREYDGTFTQFDKRVKGYKHKIEYNPDSFKKIIEEGKTKTYVFPPDSPYYIPDEQAVREDRDDTCR